MSTIHLMNLIDSIIDDAKAGILGTVNEVGVPQLRWITPGTIPGRPGFIYLITALHFAKVEQARKNSNASMLLQTRTLDKVLSLRGKLSVLENPSIRSETLERVATRLHAFWKVGTPDRDLVVLEFSINHAVFYLPQTGKKEIIPLDGGMH